MMGEPVGRQDRLFYEFDLEDMVPGDHLLRGIDAALDLSWLSGEMRPHYGEQLPLLFKVLQDRLPGDKRWQWTEQPP
jgi:hypothetical protein